MSWGKPKCSNCENDAVKEDDIYCPVSYYSCGDHECEVAVALRFWEDSSKGVRS